jgi:hypothetical protein
MNNYPTGTVTFLFTDIEGSAMMTFQKIEIRINRQENSHPAQPHKCCNFCPSQR